MSHSPASLPLRHVAIGGGTGLSTLLLGLKRHVVHNQLSAEAAALRRLRDLTAVVTVTDDGGSSGRVRRELRVLPPGDIRNCMVALSEDEPLLSRLFDYRFSSGLGLKGHSFGNLFLAALTRVTGDFAAAVRVSSDEAYAMTRRLAAEEGILAGPSSGAAMTAAIRVASKLDRAVIVVIFPDRGDRYLSTNVWRLGAPSRAAR